jgi:hypothetical protein
MKLMSAFIKIKFIIIIVMMLSISAAFAKNDLKIFNSIEFKGTNYLSKYEIIDSAKIAIKGKNLLVDMNSLERGLNDIPMVKSYKIIENNQRLIISITENRPIFLISVSNEGKNLLFEMDNEFRIISANRVHASGMPLIIISQEDIKAGRISSRAKTLLNTIYALQTKSLPVIKEIIEMDFTDGQRLKIMLKSRRTVFIIKPDIDSFNKLNYAAGYFDRIKYYPNTFTILNGLGILDRNS